ncbi:HTH-type transcriptional repressor NsrR [Paenibacillus polymyxa]|uniref:Transcriptional regulator n=4 Tax=Paenibacillus TaxID=44249 RepID=A0ABX2ZD41_PAEPO|nr:transcriptional regulator [Paenibacillus polymyxa CR1]APQ59287.1 transcriptional regulator [Paenibacillus polymyxa]MDR6779280.1 Rrf2 family protein [Paenibacillus peoriae]QNV57010.1 HTH-type transcriptional repressor NsrR [Paenibacillus polymyxa E681]ODA08085.1 transcriptional regulator [Paenibacillus polymyxa]
MHMKTGVEQSVYALLLLTMLPDKAVLPGEAISQQLGASPTYFHKLLRKLVSSDLITSVPGVKGGFKLKKKPEDIRVFDIYLAIEGQQTLYSSSGIYNEMLELKKDDQCCLLANLMEEAEASWKAVLKRETIASLSADFFKEGYDDKITSLENWIQEKMVL